MLLEKSSCVFLHASFFPASFITVSVIIASVCIQYIYVYFCMNQHMTMQHYKSRVAGVTTEVGLNTDRDLKVPTCLRNSASFIPLRYRKSRGTGHYTILGYQKITQ